MSGLVLMVCAGPMVVLTLNATGEMNAISPPEEIGSPLLFKKGSNRS